MDCRGVRGQPPTPPLRSTPMIGPRTVGVRPSRAKDMGRPSRSWPLKQGLRPTWKRCGQDSAPSRYTGGQFGVSPSALPLRRAGDVGALTVSVRNRPGMRISTLNNATQKARSRFAGPGDCRHDLDSLGPAVCKADLRIQTLRTACVGYDGGGPQALHESGNRQAPITPQTGQP